ncbi:MAG: rhombosortase [Burkholderiales bacterium]|nr:rhombosortase [Burkholderiales bacterium]ODU67038.1 MAG: rhombosortase [Lautropia sp. SCN 66-9]
MPIAWARASALALLLLLAQAASDDTHIALRLDTAGLGQGEYWRLLSAHFVHLSWPHALLNAAGVLVCCALAPDVFDRRAVWRVAGLALGVGLCLWLFSPAALPYVGLSGVLYGLFVLGLAPQALRGSLHGALALLGITAWMLWQWAAGPAPSEERLIGGSIVGVAHLYGYGLAAAALLVMAGTKRWRAATHRRT